MEISVIIPTYKPKYYLWECLNSIKNQTLNRNRFEVLIILNGDEQPFYDEIYDYLKKNNLNNFRIFYAQIKGVSNARNMGLNLAKGEYIAFVDDDDYIDEDYLTTMLETIQNEKNTICCTNYKQFDESEFEKIKLTDYLWGVETNKIEKYRKVFSSIGAKLIPISVIGKIRFDNKLKNSEDALFMSLISKNIKKISIANKKVYYNRRVRGSSANMKKKPLKEILDVFIYLTTYHFKLLFDREYKKSFILLRFFAIVKGTLYQIKNNL